MQTEPCPSDHRHPVSPEACASFTSQGYGPEGDYEHSLFCRTCGWELGDHTEAEHETPRPFADRLADAVAAGIAGRFEPSTAELARRIDEAGAEPHTCAECERRAPRPCDSTHAAWATAYLAWDEPELDRLGAVLDATCTHPQTEAGR